MIAAPAPGEPLRTARRTRGWSQSRAAEELISLAAIRGVSVAGALSLKTQLSRWENQHATPEEHYRRLLCELYDSTEVELGIGAADLAGPPRSAGQSGSGHDPLRARFAASDALDDEALTLLRAALRANRTLDHRLGAVAVADTARALFTYLRSMLWHALAPMAVRKLGALVVDAGTLAARLAQDSGEFSQSWEDLESARAAAGQAECATLLGYVLVEQASLLLEVGMSPAAVDLARRAGELLAEAQPPLRAWHEAVLGDAFARFGDTGRARTSYQAAERELGRSAVQFDIQFTEPPFVTFDRGALCRYRGHAHRVLHEHSSAVEDLDRALRAGGGSAREIATLHVDMAFAHEGLGHRAVAFEHACSARELATRIGSVRLVGELDARSWEAGDR